MLTLITGGARSGKSRFAQSLCREAGRVVYVATAVAADEEMCTRIARHRLPRPPSWMTIEEPIDLPEAARRQVEETDALLFDCITLWISNLLYQWRDEIQSKVERNAAHCAARLIEASTRGNIIGETNEVGSGIVPESTVARNFRDLQGLVNQQLASAAETVYVVVSGIPI